ncbi:MAG TPA: hypothetical protein VI136_18530, partial [Verrucomicrobiae bacterium]
MMLFRSFRRLPLLVAVGSWSCGLVIVTPAATYADFRAQAFKPADAANEMVSGKAADPDGDGVVNFAEHALGLDPTRPDASRGITWQRNDSEFGILFQSAAATQDAQLTVHWRSNLTGAAKQTLAANMVDSGAAATLLAATLPLAASGAQAFVQLSAAEVTPPAAEQRWVWFEAESSGGETGAELSNNAMIWVSPGGSVQRSVTIPSAGTYQLWVRKFWNPQAFRWRVGTSDAWKESNAQTLTDLVTLGGNAGRRVGWANVGSVMLEPGTRTFRLEVLAGDSNTTAYDCFLLTRDAFTPRGKLKPDEQPQINQPGWFAFQPAPDAFGFSPIDLRYLNEREA